MAERIYLQHFNRGVDICPVCFSSLVWRNTGQRRYTPCDVKPVMCYYEFEKPDERKVVLKGELINCVKILDKTNAAEFVGKKTFYALLPHVYTCQWKTKYR
jgi:hypothetical protein